MIGWHSCMMSSRCLRGAISGVFSREKILHYVDPPEVRVRQPAVSLLHVNTHGRAVWLVLPLLGFVIKFSKVLPIAELSSHSQLLSGEAT